MNVSYNWLKDYIDFDLTPEELAEKLTAAGLETVITEQFPEYYHSIRVGYVVSREKHPDADKLSVCQVDLGDGVPRQIICGAPNVDAGQKVPVATIGTVFPDGMKIKKAKLRGVLSHGMICSERELDLSEDHSGIMVLDENASPGTDMASYLSGNDVSLELDLTPDRPDALGHIGVARDLSALLGKPLRIPAVELQESQKATADEIAVEITNVHGYRQLDDEMVIIYNQGPGVNLSGWTLSGSALGDYAFPNLFLWNGGSVRVHTKTGSNTPSDLYWDQDAPRWFSGNVVTLKNAQGEEIASYAIP
jgi:phenylalanyl-tRNA synthetase beta chain